MNAAHTPVAPTVLRLDGELTIYRALELKQQLLAALDNAPALDLDLSEVEEIDCAGVQLLLLARRTAATRRQTLRFTALSAPVHDTLALLDLLPQFGDDIAEEA